MSEVVTKALLRLVAVPGLDRPAALITLDNGLDHAKPNTFCVGADLTLLPTVTSREQAAQIGPMGHRVFAKLRDAAVPTFAFVNGAAMGGGLELALHCRYRTLSGGASALALPETSLGLVPGWGGTQLLPNLIWPIGAAKVIIENPLRQNTMLKPREAFELGIADAFFEPADFLERSLEWAAGVVRGEITLERRPVAHDETWDFVVAYARK